MITDPRRRFAEHHDADPSAVRGLPPTHPAVRSARTLFPTRVFSASTGRRLFISGINHRKLGDRVSKGPWSGMPIFTLSLEERATCPTSCEHWLSCYGNGTPLARRVAIDEHLLPALEQELNWLNVSTRRKPGFVIRLHFLGDFPSVAYVEAWRNWLMLFPRLRVFGYTAWPRTTEIGAAVMKLSDAQWDRFAVRNSVRASTEPLPAQAGTLWRKPDSHTQPEGFVCPATLGEEKDSICCGSCGLCWSPAMRDTRILFLAHGR